MTIPHPIGTVVNILLLRKLSPEPTDECDGSPVMFVVGAGHRTREVDYCQMDFVWERVERHTAGFCSSSGIESEMVGGRRGTKGQ